MNYVKIGDVCSIHARIGWQGLTKKEYLIAGDYYLVTGVDFLNGNVDFRHCYFVSKDRYEQDVHIQVEKDDVLVTKDGTIGKVAYIAEKPQKPATLNSGVFVVRPQSTKQLLPRYLKYALESNHFSRFIESIKVGCTIPHLNQEKFLNYRIALPSLVEQMNVIEQLDIVYSLLSKKKSQISMMDELVKSRFIELFVGKNYEEKSVRDVLDTAFWLLMPATPNLLKMVAHTRTYRTLHQKENKKNRSIDFDNTLSTLTIEAYESISSNRPTRVGDILISMIGTLRPSMAVIQAARRFYGQNLYLLRLNASVVNTIFFCEFFNSDHTQHKLQAKRNQSTQAYLKANHVEDLILPLPPMEMQEQFAAFVAEVDKSKLAVKQSLEKLETLKKSLMQQYFS
ncbi:MAG: restriction endonuclease subunit S [Christensenellales bacterium]